MQLGPKGEEDTLTTATGGGEGVGVQLLVEMDVCQWNVKAVSMCSHIFYKVGGENMFSE